MVNKVFGAITQRRDYTMVVLPLNTPIRLNVIDTSPCRLYIGAGRHLHRCTLPSEDMVDLWALMKKRRDTY